MSEIEAAVLSELKSKAFAAKFLGISEASLQRLMARREVDFVRVSGLVKFRVEDLAEFIERNRIRSRHSRTAS